MAVTDRFYGANTMGTARPIQDFGLSDLKGTYWYTAKLRVKGLLVVVFFSPDSAPSVRALKTVQGWIEGLPTQKWTALAVSEGSRVELAAFAEAQGVEGVSVLVDNGLYQTRTWGVSHLPSVYLVSGQTGRVLHKIMGDDEKALGGMREMLHSEVEKLVAADAAAAKAAEEKKAAEAAAKAAEEKKAAEAAKPSDSTPPAKA